MDILKAFSLNDTEYTVNIQGTIDDPLFQANQLALILGIKNISNSLADYSSKEKVIHPVSTRGGIQKVLFLTELGLYKIISRSIKPIAKPFQEWMVNVIKELRKTGEYKLKEDHEIEKKLIRSQEQNDAKKKTHDTLMEFCKSKNVVYVCKLRDEHDGKIVIKIGSTQNIKERFSRIEYNYKMTPLLLNIFECESHTKFEKWIRNHELLKPLYFKITKQDGVDTRETFLVNEEQYDNIIKLMQKEVSQFTKEDVNKLIELEEKRDSNEEKRRANNESERANIELEKANIELEIKLEEIRTQREQIRLQIQKNNQVLENTIKLDEPVTDEKEDERDPEIPDNLFVKARENTRSPKVYQYDPETLEFIQAYDSVIAFVRNFHSSSGGALREAAKHNLVYKGFRWILAERDLTDPPIPEPTVESRTQSIEFIAMIDIKKTKILEVFPTQRDAAKSRNLAGFTTISRAIKQGSISSGHYWNFFDKCSEEMKNTYLASNKLPEPHTKTNSTTVSQIHPVTGEEIKRYKSITEVIKKFQLSRTTLYKVSENGNVHNGFKWRVIND
jgi:prophage antirepressor-like protein